MSNKPDDRRYPHLDKWDVGVYGSAKRIGELWFGLMPILVVARILVVSEINDNQKTQDAIIHSTYVNRAEFEERMRTLDERFRALQDKVVDLKDGQKDIKSMLQDLSTNHRIFPK